MGSENEILRYIGNNLGPDSDGWVVVLDGDDYLPSSGDVTVPITWPVGQSISGDAVFGDITVAASDFSGSVVFKTGNQIRMVVEGSRIITYLPFEVTGDPVAPLQVVTKQYGDANYVNAVDVWNSAWGIVATGSAPPANQALTATYVSVSSVTATLQTGRQYAVNFSARAMDVSAASNSIFISIFRDGVEIPLADKYTVAAPAGNYGGGAGYRWLIAGDGISHSYSVRSRVAAGTGTLHCQPDGGASAFTIEDIGPVTRQSSSFTPPTADWTPYDARYAPITASWNNLTLATPWTNYGGGYANAQYRKVGDMVHLRGLIKCTDVTPTVLSTLPAGFRPAYKSIFAVWLAGNGAAVRFASRLDVDVDGVVNASTAAASTPSGTTNAAITSVTHLSLDGIVFSTTA